ncbi:MAG: hypothetical protein KKI09_12760, partial [Spirochaetes bacterium]|nr:hypothetical protein [Spirochaetota bacterium]MBU0956292.1 hypothetical protein [Spirochaetota bacterium]
GTTTSRSSPAKVAGLPRITQVAVGSSSVYALSETGEVWVWGRNTWGQLGLGDKVNKLLPVMVSGIPVAIGVASCDYVNASSAFILLADRTLLATGQNFASELGFTSASLSSWTVVPGMSDIVEVAAMRSSTLVRKTFGEVWGCGSNAYGTMGSSVALNASTVPWTQIEGLSGVVELAASGYRAAARIDSGGTMTWYFWGDRGYGQFGDDVVSFASTPRSVDSPATFIKFAAGAGHVLALDAAGDVWAWGDNAKGQVGDGSSLARITAAKVLDLAVAVVAISAQFESSTALLADGRVVTWGDGVSSPAVQTDVNLYDIVQVATGRDFRLALRNDGTVWGWGTNSFGQLGNGTTAAFPNGVHQMKDTAGSGFITDVVSIAAGRIHSLVILQDGTALGCGDNDYGQIGGSGDSLLPRVVNGVSSITSVKASENYSLFVTSAGVTWAVGQIRGVGNSTPYLFFGSYYAPTISGVVSYELTAAYSYNNTMLLMNDGTLRTNGYNGSLQIGDGSCSSADSWKTPAGPVNVVCSAVGEGWMLAYSSDGTLWGWGDSSRGSLGPVFYQPVYATTPVAVAW